jgi:hypothetical protein
MPMAFEGRDSSDIFNAVQFLRRLLADLSGRLRPAFAGIGYLFAKENRKVGVTLPRRIPPARLFAFLPEMRRGLSMKRQITITIALLCVGRLYIGPADAQPSTQMVETKELIRWCADGSPVGSAACTAPVLFALQNAFPCKENRWGFSNIEN